MTDIKVVAPANMGSGIKWNPTTKQYEVGIVDLTPINNSISELSNEIGDLKNRPDRDTIYDDTVLKNELASLRDLVNSIQNTTSNVKYFKVPLSVSHAYDNSYTTINYYRVSFSNYVINENINNIHAIECRGTITSSKAGISSREQVDGISVDLTLRFKINSGTSILVRGSGGHSVDPDVDRKVASDRYDTGYAVITLYLK